MGLMVKNYKLGGSSSSIVADVYVQCGRQPIAVQRKKVTNDPTPKWEVIYVAVAHSSKEENQHICPVKQTQAEITSPLWESPYAFAYEDLKKWLTEQGYEYTDVDMNSY